jgi:hypothetical protein
MAFDITITNAGRAALVNAANTGTLPVTISQFGLSTTAVVPNPALVALAGEFKRLPSLAGLVVADDTIHVTLRDSSADAYALRSIGLYLADGTLFAVYGQAGPILEKTAGSVALLSVDVIFADISAASITFGSTEFIIPPATETVQGVVELATQAETNTGTDDQRAVTPLKLAARLMPIVQAITDEIAARVAAVGAEAASREAADAALSALITALTGRTITGSGLVTGGGSLAANRVLNVAAATAAQIIAGTVNNAAMTPGAFGPIIRSFGQTGYIILALADPANALAIQWGRITASANSSTFPNFPIAFTETYSVVGSGTADLNNNAQDNFPAVVPNGINTTGFQVWNSNNTADPFCWLAIGRINLT